MHTQNFEQIFLESHMIVKPEFLKGRNNLHSCISCGRRDATFGRATTVFTI